MTRPELWPRRTERLELRQPSDADLDAVLAWRNHPEVNRWLLHTEVEPEAYRELWASGADDPFDHHVVAVTAGTVVGTLSVMVDDGMGQGPDSPALQERGPARLPPGPGAPRPRLRDRDGPRGARPGLRRPRRCDGSRPAASPTTSRPGGSWRRRGCGASSTACATRGTPSSAGSTATPTPCWPTSTADRRSCPRVRRRPPPRGVRGRLWRAHGIRRRGAPGTAKGTTSERHPRRAAVARAGGADHRRVRAAHGTRRRADHGVLRVRPHGALACTSATSCSSSCCATSSGPGTGSSASSAARPG